MSTAKRLVLSFRRRKQNNTSVPTTSSTRLVSGSTSPGHEIDEISVLPGSSHPLIYRGGGGQYGECLVLVPYMLCLCSQNSKLFFHKFPSIFSIDMTIV